LLFEKINRESRKKENIRGRCKNNLKIMLKILREWMIK
jgi:hypothetical protein